MFCVCSENLLQRVGSTFVAGRMRSRIVFIGLGGFATRFQNMRHHSSNSNKADNNKRDWRLHLPDTTFPMRANAVTREVELREACTQTLYQQTSGLLFVCLFFFAFNLLSSSVFTDDDCVGFIFWRRE